jgi:predicted AAA+ superfamily ATPase
LGRHLLSATFQGSGIYLNWGNPAHRKSILKQSWHDAEKLIVLDEIHKYKRWKSWLKGIYDVQGDEHSFLITGSARLDVYRRGGDSMLGRYHYWRLHPFTLDEYPGDLKPEEAFDRLFRFGGFPEPFIRAEARFAKRWRRDRIDRIINEDIRDVENVRDLSLMGLFADALRTRVGSTIAVANIAADLEISPKTSKKWLELLERLYVGFAVYPYAPKNLARLLSKQPKFYFFDNADVDGTDGARFENLVACHLLKRLHFQEDSEGDRCELRYIRDKEKREIDFVILRNRKVDELIEVKLSDSDVSKTLQDFAAVLKPRRTIQLVAKLEKSYKSGGVEVLSVFDYFADKLW